VRAQGSSAIKGESPQQHHGHLDSPFTKGRFQALPDFLPSPQRGGGTSLLCGRRPPASRTLGIPTVVQQAARSHCFTLTPNARLGTELLDTRLPSPHPHPEQTKHVIQFPAYSWFTVSIYNLLEILQRCKLFHTMSQRLQSANKIF